ncbi:MAG: ATP-dependent Clp protease ATP-binding subunit [bacterium]|nr:ATP-dependent Clp protease ATP-binding subunit [bacterium]
MSKRLTEKFTDRAKRSLAVAAREAKQLGSSLVDTEHILLGVLQDETSVAFKVLASFQIDAIKVKEAVVASTDPRDKSNEGEEGFSEAAQESIAAAALQAYLWGSAFVGTEHILCGLAKTPSGLACHILRSWGVTYESLKNRVESYSPYQNPTTTPKEPNTPLLNTYSRDLTVSAREKKLDPVIGREIEIQRLIQVLSRRTKNNPVLLGDAGVGKTAIVEGLAQRIVDREVPSRFFNTRLINLDLNALVAGTRFRGDFEERLLGIMDEIKEASNIILFIDEIQTIVGAGGAGGALDAANILKPALARGEMRCIGATTIEEYAHFIEDDAALERRFQPILVGEPDGATTIKILEGLKSRYENFHGVKIKKEAIELSVKLAARYLTERHLPDSAIDILDEAASKKSVSLNTFSKDILKIEESLQNLRDDKEELVKVEEYEEAMELREREKRLSTKLNIIVSKDPEPKNSTFVTAEDVASVVSMITGVPVEELTSNEAERLLNLEKELGRKVVGQDEVLKDLASVLRRSRVGLRDPRRPIGSFIFLGTSGVGKTLVARTLAEVIFEDPESLIRLDMSEFSERHTVSRLVGAPPGYVGFEEGGELTDRLKRRPYSVILLDEVEKAHPEVFNILLQVLEDGQLMDGKGRVINFRNAIIIMTSNVGSHLIRREGDIGFVHINPSEKRAIDATHKDLSQKLTGELRKMFKVEFLNRVDSILVFKPLHKDSVKKIAKLLLDEVKIRLKDYRIKLDVQNKVYDFLVKKGFSTEFGARELRRLIQEEIEDPLSEGILSGTFSQGQKLSVKVDQDKIVLK